MIKVACLRLTRAGRADGFWAKILRSLNVAAFGAEEAARRVGSCLRLPGSRVGEGKVTGWVGGCLQLPIPVWRGPAIPYNIRYAFPCAPQV